LNFFFASTGVESMVATAGTVTQEADTGDQDSKLPCTQYLRKIHQFNRFFIWLHSGGGSHAAPYLLPSRQ
jgi:hypothetical protein